MRIANDTVFFFASAVLRSSRHHQSSRSRTRQPQVRANNAPSAPAPVQGELIAVDAEKKTLSVKTDQGEVQFAYTDRTEISGGQKAPAGLASAKNNRVTVHYTVDAESKAKTATRVIIQEKQ